VSSMVPDEVYVLVAVTVLLPVDDPLPLLDSVVDDESVDVEEGEILRVGSVVPERVALALWLSD